MGTSIVEKSLADIEALLEEAKAVPFSNKVVVDQEEILKLVEDIRLNMPGEITQAKRIAQERRDILDKAQLDAEEIIDKARQRADIMIEEHQITKEAKCAAEDIFRQTKAEADTILSTAKRNAEEVTQKAEKWSNDIRRNASAYVETIIRDTDETLTRSVNDIRKLRQSVKDALGHNAGSSRPDFND